MMDPEELATVKEISLVKNRLARRLWGEFWMVFKRTMTTISTFNQRENEVRTRLDCFVIAPPGTCGLAR